MQIGAQIRINDHVTAVGANGECYSACGLIWVAGVRRYISPTSKIGFHAAYIEENGQYKESGVRECRGWIISDPSWTSNRGHSLLYDRRPG
ncbi:hypothetical protein [Mesorhizobium australicum]|uniref:hypothetical protein n=1 Tax=Mesorhizobium australicum TaxID=536018 RepID=UPI003338A1C4